MLVQHTCTTGTNAKQCTAKQEHTVHQAAAMSIICATDMGSAKGLNLELNPSVALSPACACKAPMADDDHDAKGPTYDPIAEEYAT
jgi:hypothetical protein